MDNIDKMLIEYVETILKSEYTNRAQWAFGAIDFARHFDLVDFETWHSLRKEMWNTCLSESNGKGVE